MRRSCFALLLPALNRNTARFVRRRAQTGLIHAQSGLDVVARLHRAFDVVAQIDRRVVPVRRRNGPVVHRVPILIRQVSAVLDACLVVQGLHVRIFQRGHRHEHGRLRSLRGIRPHFRHMVVVGHLRLACPARDAAIRQPAITKRDVSVDRNNADAVSRIGVRLELLGAAHQRPLDDSLLVLVRADKLQRQARFLRGLVPIGLVYSL